MLAVFQSTPPERGATQKVDTRRGGPGVSIHAPREGSDHQHLSQPQESYCFNPRPPRGERPKYGEEWELSKRFQSTPPERGATCIPIRTLRRPRRFNPRPPRGERQAREGQGYNVARVSIHAPREGSDAVCIPPYSWIHSFNPRPPRGERPHSSQSSLYGTKFQSTPPERGATYAQIIRVRGAQVSIHAPREGSDDKIA